MSIKFLALLKFEIRNNLRSKSKIIFNSAFFLINLALFPFILDPNSASLRSLFLPVLLINLSLASVIITQNVFYDDDHDGTLDMLSSYGIKIEQVFLAKLISYSLEFFILLVTILPFAGIFYNLTIADILSLLACILSAVPIMIGVSIFTSLLTLNLKNAYILAIILTLPLLIAVLIFLSLACSSIFDGQLYQNNFIQINFGLSLLFIPIEYLLVKFLK